IILLMKPFYTFLKSFFVFLVLKSLLLVNAEAQLSGGGLPASILHNLDGSAVPFLTFELTQDQAQIKATRLDEPKAGIPMHAGFALPANIFPERKAKWEVVENKKHVWRLKIKAPGALGIGLNFDAFELQEGAKLFFYTPDRSEILGSFTHLNNNEFQIFSTRIVPGDAIVIEYEEPYYPGKPATAEQSLLRLESVTFISSGRGLVSPVVEKDLGASGTCNVNINCPEGINWQTQKRGVALLLLRSGNNWFYCSGSLVNNTRHNGDMLFLTAAHCGDGASARDRLFWHFYFNFERSGCLTTDIPPHHLLVGADLVASGPLNGGSDFSLLRLKQTPPTHWRLVWNGWDRSGLPSASGVGIHHPAGDAKKISTFNQPVVTSNPTISGNRMATNSAWTVVWAQTLDGRHGIVEPGSSGSPLFNSEGLIFGTLAGGLSSCATPFEADFYGRMFHHWDLNGINPSQRLAPHLDPLGTGVTQLQGLDPHFEQFPPPGHITATLQTASRATVRWWAPGSFPHQQGWYAKATTPQYLSWSRPERAVIFEAPALNLSYPVILSMVRHHFHESAQHPWPDNRFTFKIYGKDGTTLLHESPIIAASKTGWTTYSLPQPITLPGPFYVAVRPIDLSGHPSTVAMRVNYGQGYSFVGTAGNWEMPLYFDNFSGSLSYITQIYVLSAQSNQAGSTAIQSFSGHAGKTTTAPNEGTVPLQALPAANPTGYKVFRNGSLLHTVSATEPLSFTDTVVPVGLVEYEVTATYATSESDPGARAFLLNPQACAVTISTFPYVQNFPAEFDSTCWLNMGISPWMLASSVTINGTTINPVQSVQFYNLQTTAISQTNQWLILPQIDMSNLADPALRFSFNGIYRPEGQRLKVWASKGNEAFTLVWDSHAHPVFAAGERNLQWISNTVNLFEMRNQSNVRIAFQMEGTGEGFFAIDLIELLSGATISRNISIVVNPEFSGMVSGGGNFLAGQAVTLQARPNTGYLFSGWFREGIQQSSQPLYSFIMPDAHLAMTASFLSDPTTVPSLPEEKPAFEVYPNPAKNYVMIRFNENHPNTLLRLYNALGRLVLAREPGNLFTGHVEQIITSGLPRGVYFLNVQSAKGVWVRTIILMN
ncbi:MAG TPA: T9SS type A sorting domain-containing protein, partial [Bacteroidales bacterium]|nr:T9SS type A sorting domain-containing protein [Bacteroidales bacterium]